MKNFILLSLLVFSVGCLFGQTTISGKVVNVIEGDIMEILTDDNETIPVKIKNIECPELSQEYGLEAKKFTQKHCLNKMVEVVFETYDRDRNALAVVTMEKDNDLGYELIKNGLAWHYTKGLDMGPHSQAYLDLERKVKEKAKGLWKNPNPVAPWTYRAHQNKWEGKISI